jgi:hypothetical protein
MDSSTGPRLSCSRWISSMMTRRTCRDSIHAEMHEVIGQCIVWSDVTQMWALLSKSRCQDAQATPVHSGRLMTTRMPTPNAGALLPLLLYYDSGASCERKNHIVAVRGCGVCIISPKAHAPGWCRCGRQTCV